MADKSKTYVGVVEDNADPKKLGRLKIRVMDVYEGILTEDIPWANPWKDLNGNEFNLPEIGKVMVVTFDQGNENSPEYIYADHYNVNLEKKLASMDISDYKSMKSIIFDHKTQFYINDTEGLKLDYKYNNINIKSDSINLNLKDNNANLNLGDESADQQAILGNYFIDWLGKFLDTLQNGGLYNAGGPTMANPALVKLILEFKATKDLKFLSHNVNVVDNNGVRTVANSNREDEAQYGDAWTSSQEENNLTDIKDDNNKPKDGPRDEFNV